MGSSSLAVALINEVAGRRCPTSIGLSTNTTLEPSMTSMNIESWQNGMTNDKKISGVSHCVWPPQCIANGTCHVHLRAYDAGWQLVLEDSQVGCHVHASGCKQPGNLYRERNRRHDVGVRVKQETEEMLYRSSARRTTENAKVGCTLELSPLRIRLQRPPYRRGVHEIRSACCCTAA